MTEKNVRTAKTLSIEEWLDGAPIPWPGIAEPGEGEPFTACYAVELKSLLLTKDDKPYLRLRLTDASGTIEARIWDDADQIDTWIDEGAYVGVRGRINSFRGQRQLRVDEIRPLEVGPGDLQHFLPTTPYDLEELEGRLDQIIDSVGDLHLRELLVRLVGRESETGRAFRRAPAAKRNHHAYIGGLLEHTLSMTELADLIARHYHEDVDRDLLIAGAILHDIGKIEEIELSGGFPYTDPGKLLGHILLGIELVRETAKEIEGLTEERLTLLLHLIASHQGKYEWQSPRIPHTLEALILHFVDDLDAKVNQVTRLIRSVETGWSPYAKNFGAEFLRHLEDREERELDDQPKWEEVSSERVNAERVVAEESSEEDEISKIFADQVSLFDD